MDLPSTEGRSVTRRALDLLSAAELAAAFEDANREAAAAVASARGSIARAIELAADALERGGRLILGGAGTSGRLAVLEAVECGPTFRSDRVLGVMAGGEGAFLRAREGAEDDRQDGARAARALEPAPADLFLGIAASGRTPWVLGLLEAARAAGARTGLVACAAPPDGLAAEGLALDLVLVLPTGPELLSGSTRLKAGTATKCALNAITTGAMARQGKVMDDLMVDVAPTNDKLRARARRIVSELVPADERAAGELLERSGWEVKTAVVAGRLGLSAADARARLTAARGHLRRCLEERPA